jgi:hypothetical protein
MTRTTARRAAAITTGLVLIGGGGAFAYIEASGGGGGTAQSAELKDVVLTGSVTGLGPNDKPTPITVTYTNPNKFKVTARNGISIEVADDDPIPADCAKEKIDVSGITASVDFEPGVTTAIPLPSHEGGTVTWAYDKDNDQSTCLKALAKDSFGLKLTVN